MIEPLGAGRMHQVVLKPGDRYDLPFAATQILGQELEQLEKLCEVEYRPASIMLSRKPRETVGTVQVRNYYITVAPRDLTPRTLLGMVLTVTGVNTDIARPGQHVLSHGRAADQLSEALAGLLIVEAERSLRRHVAQAYVEHEEPLSILMGRPLFLEFGRPRRPGTLPCRYELKTTDVLPNQLLLAGVRAAQSLVTDERLLRRATAVNFALRELASDIRPSRTDFERAFTRLNRQSIHYADPLHLAEAVIFGYRDKAEDVVAPGPVFEVWRLFQDFVARIVEDAVGDFGLQAIPQATDRKRLIDRGEDTYREVTPDLVLTRVQQPRIPVAVLDAKYRPEYLGGGPGRPPPQNRASTADIYQLLFYAEDLRARHKLLMPLPSAIVSPQLSRFVAPSPRWRTIRWPREKPAAELRLRVLSCPVDAMVECKLGGGSAPDALRAAPELDGFVRGVARRSHWL